MPRVMSIVGFKESGKTTLIERLIRELVRRGFRVGVIKYANRPYPLDTPEKDVWRYSHAGAEALNILTPRETVIFLHKSEKLGAVIKILEALDLILLEDFRELDIVPRIILAKDKSEVQKLKNGLEVAVIGKITSGTVEKMGIPVLDLYATQSIAEIIHDKSIPLLPGLNCGKCGYSSCRELVKEILKGKAEVLKCFNMPSKDVQVVLDGTPLRINPFVGRIIQKVVMGVLSTLKGIGTPKTVKLTFEVKKEAKQKRNNNREKEF